MFLYILYEYVNGGELWRKCKVYGIPSEDLIKYYFNQILIGVEHLHKYNIVHRDLKPENVMVTKDDLTLKIIDFGSCKDLDGTQFEKHFEERNKTASGSGRRNSTFKNFQGTPQYMAPECVRNKDSTKASDCWSLACILYHLYVGFPPYLGKTDYLVFIESTEAKYKFPESIVNKLAEDLIKRLMLVNPNDRLTLNEIRNHEFMKGYTTKGKYPIFKLSEIALEKIKESIKNLANNYREIGVKHNKYKKEEDQRNYESSYSSPNDKPEKTPEEVEQEKLNAIEYEVVKKKYSEGLEFIKNQIENIQNTIEKNEVLTSEQKKCLTLKIYHFQKQVLYDVFNIPMVF